MTEKAKLVSMDYNPDDELYTYEYTDGSKQLRDKYHKPLSTLAPSPRLQNYMREQVHEGLHAVRELWTKDSIEELKDLDGNKIHFLDTSENMFLPDNTQGVHGTTVQFPPVTVTLKTAAEVEAEYIEKRTEVRRETDPNGVNAHEPGAKLDAGKNRVWLFMSGFARALESVSEVTTIGAKKYTPNGWRSVVDGEARYWDAFGRHLLKLGKGEVYDNGPNGIGTRHLSQMIWNLLAVLELQLEKEENGRQ